MTDPPRVDVVPAAFLALLIELGVHPAQLGVTTMHSRRHLAWDTARPETVEGRAVAHIERPALELALLAALERTSDIRVMLGKPTSTDATGARIIDATGRRALSARWLIQPPDPFVARVFSWRGRFDFVHQEFQMAALPAGYVYRLATPGLMTLGVVLSRSVEFPPASVIKSYIQDGGASWILSRSIDLDAAVSGRGGIASVQWCSAESEHLPIGDASLARDSLSAQGLATGLADAINVATYGSDGSRWSQRRYEQLQRHLHHLATTINRSRFRTEVAWARYHRFICSHLG
jgi:hypothetical protein